MVETGDLKFCVFYHSFKKDLGFDHSTAPFTHRHAQVRSLDLLQAIGAFFVLFYILQIFYNEYIAVCFRLQDVFLPDTLIF